MFLSKFAKKIFIKKDVYGIYNSLLMDIIYCDKEEALKIFNMDITDESIIQTLKEKCIYIDNVEKDTLAIETIKNEYKNNTNIIDFGYFILTSNCNLACKYCFIENNKKNNGQVINMSTMTAKITIDKIDMYCTKNNINEFLVIFYGGEPFINFNVMKFIVNYCKGKNTKFNFSCVSNATLLNGEIIKFLKENKVNLSISVDGYKELNDSNRIFNSTKESVYESVSTAMKLLKEYEIDYGLSVTISSEIIKNKKKFFSWLDEISPKYFSFNLMHYSEKTDEWRKYYPKASKLLIDSYIMHEFSSYFNEDRINRKMSSIAKKEFKYTDCGAAGNNQIVIKPNGDTCLCHGYFKTDDKVTGNIIKNDIEDIVFNEKNKIWVNRVPILKPKCINCNALFVCGGGCGMQSEILFDSINNIDIPFCIHTKKTLKWILLKDYLNNK